jgi:uncharacterized flavoprotein (TIGR03862 family)
MHVIVVGAGPAGLMAADVISAAGVGVTVYERTASAGRKLLMAGRGGLNLTHSEALAAFMPRYGAARAFLDGPVAAFPPEALRAFVHGLGEDTFVGSSGRVFPRAMKASPLLRAWLRRLAAQGVEIRTRHRLVGFDGERRALIAREGEASVPVAADAVVLALGGASWPRLGSDGAWVPWLAALGVGVRPLVAANVGVAVAWSPHFRDRFAGAPLKRVAVTVDGQTARGEAMVTWTGLEGGAIYALTPVIRSALARDGRAAIHVDLRPDMTVAALESRLARPRGKLSTSAWLDKTVRLAPVAAGLLREATGNALPADGRQLAGLIKDARLEVSATGAIDRAISSAGGVALDGVDAGMMLTAYPGLFVAGEMLDWEAPTGGYLLQACFATGRAAGAGVLRYLGAGTPAPMPATPRSLATETDA